jgi:AbrB family looped-hinge helix DNA binding protein
MIHAIFVERTTRENMARKSIPHTRTRQWVVPVGGGGRVVIPAELRQALGVAAGDAVVFESNGTDVKMRSHGEVLRTMQEKYKQRWRKPEFSVDAFLAQRKAAWGED